MAAVSVVIPCYNGAKYVVAAVRSALAQGHDDLEVIVVDDGSSDGSAELVTRNVPQAIVLRQPNRGVAAARNLGIARASGHWIAFLDADDIWLPGKLAAQLDALQTHPEARLVYGAWQVWPSADAEPDPSFVDELLSGAADSGRWTGPSGWIYSALLLDCEVWTSTVLVQASLLDEIGVFDRGLRVGEDYDLWLRASRVTPIVRVPRPLALYRMHPGNITRSAPAENYRARVVSLAVDRWGYDCCFGSPAQPRDVRRALAGSWADFAAANYLAGRFDRARRGGWQALRTDPSHFGGWKILAKSLAGSLIGPPVVQG